MGSLIRRILAYIGRFPDGLKAIVKWVPRRTDAARMRPARIPVPATLAALTSGVLYALCFAPTPAAWGGALAWVALVPLAAALRGRSVLGAAALAAAWAAVATAAVIRWMVPTLVGHFGWSSFAAVSFLGALSLLTAAPWFALTFGLTQIDAARRGSLARGVLFAAAFVGAELLRGHLGLQSPWATLGVTQFEAERLRQMADWAGVYGVSALVAFVNAALAELVARPRRAAWRPLAAAAAVVVMALGYGQWRIAGEKHDPEATATLDVALVQGNVRPELRWQSTRASTVLRRYGGLTRDALLASETRPDLVVWPENALQTPVDDAVYGPPLRALARAAPLLMGAPRPDRVDGRRVAFNAAHWIDRDGHVAHYDKRRLLPFSESRPWGDLGRLERRGDLDGGVWAAGEVPGVFPMSGHAIGVLICLEALHPALAREAVAEGAEVLVNLSNDGWFVGPGAAEQHFAQVVFRAVETRRPLLRATPTGVTAVVSSSGEVRARLPAGQAGVLRASVSWPEGPPSLYARIGDVFAWGCLLLAAAPALHRLGRGATGQLAAGDASPGSYRRTA